MLEADVVVIGAGVVGLACAAELARRGRDVVVLEQARAIGTGISSRNSEVIHAGLYYPTGSLKHTLCVEGRYRLYKWLESRNVAHRKCGKLVVATSEEDLPVLSAIEMQAKANGVEDIVHLTRQSATALEPSLTCKAALHSAETGILDTHGYMLSLQGALEDHGGVIAFGSPVSGGRLLSDGHIALSLGGTDPQTLRASTIINAAGLYAVPLARAIEGFPPEALPEMILAKGSYFSCQVPPAFERLIYPVPIDGGLGVHLTLDLGGQMRFGPDVEWLDQNGPCTVDYSVAPDRATSFYSAIRKYWPGLPDDSLTPAYSGCRPKLSHTGEPTADFRIDGPAQHGLPGLINLFGIESPGLTASLAIADHASDMTEA
ncbi:NAD(P)/FAD-dependent oxidoreductase [Hyphomonas pacifica]|uniref:NAD(P)/FAD-dependent oxidoreductase n=1 Tax=Hyphomonas pacifica TaxID=1280941 RepID=UPI000DC01453|nr:NAD(P)/FAD-dependent oxidoreductase [Hyphomonas pacifica]RAN32905.1 hypothetical protein HY11_04245 [Hyphomonas pacifica]